MWSRKKHIFVLFTQFPRNSVLSGGAQARFVYQNGDFEPTTLAFTDAVLLCHNDLMKEYPHLTLAKPSKLII